MLSVAKPDSVTRSRVPSDSGSRKNSTSVELSSVAVTPGWALAHRYARWRGGSTATISVGKTPYSPWSRRMTPPGRRSISAGWPEPNQLPTCSGSVMTAHTRSTGALMKVSRSIRSLFMTASILSSSDLCATLRLHIDRVKRSAPVGGQGTETVMYALVRRRARQHRFPDGGVHGVVRVADVARRRGAGLRDELVRVEGLQARQLADPGDQVVLADP